MSPGANDPAYVLLLRDVIQTFEELDVVLALVDAGTARTAGQLAAACRLPEPMAAAAAERLRDTGLVVAVPPDGYALDRSDPQRASAVDELRGEFAHNRLAVMTLMTENALRRVRSSAMRAFARAFLFGSRDDG